MVELKNFPARRESRSNSICVNDCFQIIVEDNKTVPQDSKDSLSRTADTVNSQKVPEGSDFEEAIEATGYGKFNILLLLCAFPAFSTAVYVSSTLSYIMTSAECDLNMSMVDMGKLNIFTYCGMMSSALIWGFLSDTLGRKKIMVWGFIATAVCELAASQSQTYLVLSMAKYCAGFVFNGPFAILISYISEMHAASIRAKVLVYIGAFYALGNMNLPLIAWGIIPQDWSFTMFNGAYVLHSWQIFLALFSFPPFATGLALMLLPESPKFLMSRGRNEEALKIFQKMFAMNKGLPEDQFPIKCLINERAGTDQAPQGWEAMKGGLKQLQPLVSRAYIWKITLICFIMSITMLGSNTLRLWFPQMATIIEDYDSKHEETAPLCSIVDSYVSNKTVEIIDDSDLIKECVKMDSGVSTYVNSIIIGAASFVAYMCGGFLINTLGKRKLNFLGMVGSGTCALALYWSNSLPEVVALFSVFLSVTSLVGSVISSIAVDMFPTSIRAMAVAIIMMMGRMGTVLGGIAFPYLLEMGCLAPFVAISAILIIGGMLTLVLPRTTLQKMN